MKDPFRTIERLAAETHSETELSLDVADQVFVRIKKARGLSVRMVVALLAIVITGLMLEWPQLDLAMDPLSAFFVLFAV